MLSLTHETVEPSGSVAVPLNGHSTAVVSVSSVQFVPNILSTICLDKFANIRLSTFVTNFESVVLLASLAALAAAEAARDANNTTLAKFVTNVESRIFANLSKQMVDNMFGTNCAEDTDTDAIECPLSGTATLPDGSTVYWAKDTTAETITLTVTDASGTITQLIVPVGDFKF